MLSSSETTTGTVIRPPAVAGTFYPFDPGSLRELVRNYLDAANADRRKKTWPKAVIAPHAGYMYSGPIAGSAFAPLAPGRDKVHRVVLLGPSHRVPFTGIAMSSADAFVTPLGAVPLEKSALRALMQLPFIKTFDEAHAHEHSLETHLPFLQVKLGSFYLIPLVFGQCTPEQVAKTLDLLWGKSETVIAISSDLSHYYDYKTAQRMDRATSDAIESLSPDRIAPEQACGRTAIQGLLIEAKKRKLVARTVDLRNSGDTAGPRNEVVGYGAYIFN